MREDERGGGFRRRIRVGLKVVEEEVGRDGGGGREEEASLGVIMTNTEIKFHISLFTLH